MIGKNATGRFPLRSAIALFSALVSAISIGCQAPAAIDAWAIGDSAALSPTTPRQSDGVVFDPDACKICLHSAANETVSFQLVIDAPPAGLSDVKVCWSDLAGGEGRKIAASNIRAFRCLAPPEPAIPPWYPVLIGSPPPGDLYDILVPVDSSRAGQLPNLTGGQRLAMWFDLEVPRTTKGDIYNGSLSIIAEGASTWKATIELKVYDIVLPDQRPVLAIGGFDYRRLFAAMVRRDGQPYIPVRLDPNNKQVQRGLAIIRRMVNLARQHGLDMFETQVHPLLKRDVSGSIRMDWQDYDAIVCAYLDGSAFDDKAGAAAWPMPCEADWPNAEYYGGPASSEYETAARETLAACLKHFATKGWAQRAFLWPSRRLTDEGANPTWRKLAGQMDVVILTSVADTDAASRPANKPRKMIVTSHEDADAAVAPRADEKPSDSLAGYWLTPGLGIRTPSLAAPALPIDARALVLMAMKDGYRGLFIDDCLHWDSAGQPVADKACLFYPSTEDGDPKREGHPDTSRLGIPGQVLPSIRLKQFRRGMQDAAYLQLLRRHNRDKTASMILDTLTRRVNSDKDESDMQSGQGESAHAVWELARRLMVEELNSAINSPSPPRSIAAGSPSPAKTTSGALFQQIAWDRYWNQSRTVRVESARCRAALGDAGRFKAQLSVGLLNELAGKLEAQVAWQNLPEGWQAVGSSERSATLEAFSRLKVALSVEGGNIPATESAKVPMSFSLAIEGAEPRPLVAEMALLQAAVFSSPPAIDGSLDDWPLRSGNCAGNFVLLPRADGRSGQVASKQTLVFAAVDGNSLYLAFRCKEDNPASLKANPNNLVRYEQYLPGGEDLVEVLLDPGNSSRTIEDIYHIAVKPNGAVLAQRGVACNPPLSQVKPWTGPTSVAVGRAKGVWIVEMSIPLEAFGPAGRECCWGVNFVRFNPAGPEASSWSQAVRHFYDPSTFGLMILPAPAATGPAVSGQR